MTLTKYTRYSKVSPITLGGYHAQLSVLYQLDIPAILLSDTTQKCYVDIKHAMLTSMKKLVMNVTYHHISTPP